MKYIHFQHFPHMGVGAAMFGGGWQEAQEVEQRPCEGAKSSEEMTFQTGFRQA
jgi:hypothetical protein